MASPLHIISPTSIAATTHRLWVVFEADALEVDLPDCRVDANHLVAEWPTDVELDVRAALNAAHKQSAIRFSYLQPATPAETRRMPPGPRTTAVLSNLQKPSADAPHAGLFTDLCLELEKFCPDLVTPGWRLVDAWPHSDLMIERLSQQRCGREKALTDVLNLCLERRIFEPGLTVRKHFGLAGSDDPLALLEVAVLGHELPDSPAAISAAMNHLTGSGLGKLGYKLTKAGNFPAAWVAFDHVPADLWDTSAHANALWAIQADNSGLGVQPERARRYLERALPYGTRNPAIYFNGACVCIELGAVDSCLACIQNAVRFSDHQLDDAIRNEPMFAPLIGTPEFEAAFDVESASVERERLRAARDAERAAVFATFAAELPESRLAATLLAWVDDMSRHDQAMLLRVKGALARPPKTPEEIGFYPSRDNTPIENCYRFAVSQLHRAGLLMAAEDKYSDGVFKQFAQHITLPDGVSTLRRRHFDPAEFLPLMAQIDAAFAAKGLCLTTVSPGGGDHVYFAALPRDVAEKWLNVVVATTHDAQNLGLRPPCWGTLFDHLSYALGWDGKLDGWHEPEWKSA